MEIGTPLGLAFVSGINAYFPLLAFAVAARWIHLYKVNPHFAFVTSDWFIIALVVLTIVDFVADKIPVVDHTWDATHTVVRPIAGALVAVASSNQVIIPTNTSAISSHVLSAASVVTGNIHITGAGLLVLAVVGGILAFLTHSAKATTRLLSTFTTAGFLNIILSIGEDIFVIIATLLSLFIPVIMLIVIVLFFLVTRPSIFRSWSRRKRLL
jgi:Domain of unknown function (DUF4126)